MNRTFKWKIKISFDSKNGSWTCDKRFNRVSEKPSVRFSSEMKLKAVRQKTSWNRNWIIAICHTEIRSFCFCREAIDKWPVLLLLWSKKWSILDQKCFEFSNEYSIPKKGHVILFVTPMNILIFFNWNSIKLFIFIAILFSKLSFLKNGEFGIKHK